MLGIAAASAILAACGPGKGAAHDGAPKASDLMGTLQHVYWANPVELPLQYAMDSFVKRVPGAKIDLVLIPNAQVQEKLILLVAAGTPPDSAQIDPRQLTPLIEKGILMDVSRYAKRDAKEFQQDDFFPAALERLTKSGKIYGAPNQMGIFVLLYNQDALAGGGEKLPDESWTWETLAQVAQRLTTGEGDARRWGTTAPGWEILVWAYGGEILDKTEKICLLNDPKAQAGLQWLQDIRYRYQCTAKPGEDSSGLTAQQRFLPQYDEMTKIIDTEWSAVLANNTKSVKDATESAKRQVDALLAGS